MGEVKEVSHVKVLLGIACLQNHPSFTEKPFTSLTLAIYISRANGYRRVEQSLINRALDELVKEGILNQQVTSEKKDKGSTTVIKYTINE